MCFTACPAGYAADSTNVCIWSSDSALSLSLQNLIYLDSVSSVQVGSSNSNAYPTWDSSDPIPSISRGYYFISGKYMDAGAFMMSPFYTVTIWVKPIGLGYLMVKLDGSTEMFGIHFDINGDPIVEATLSDGSSVSLTTSSSLFGSWHNLAYTGNIVTGYTTISLYLDGAATPTTQTSTSMQPFIDSGSLLFGYSSIADSFQGFLWSVKIYNKNTYQASEWIASGCPSSCSSGCPSEQLCPDSCLFGEYDDGGCQVCDSAFSCSYGCRSWDTCRLCKAKECDTCTTFTGDCTHCITNAEIVTGNTCACKDVAFWVHSSQSCELYDGLCSKCLGSYYFECQTCISGAQKVDNICLHACPYGFDSSCNYPASSQVINEVFGDNFRGQYGEFITGTSASSYQFFNSPEVNIDPTQAKNRGLYFTNGSYLQASTIYLNYKFSIGFWANVKTAGDMLEKQPNLRFSSDASSIVYLENPSLVTASVSTLAITYTAGWNYFAITIAYTPGSTAVTCYVNAASSSPATITNNCIFRDVSSQQIIIGKSSASSTFEGFIYNFNLWTDTITDFSYQINNDICNTGQGHSCLWDCYIDKYQDTDGSCKSCNSCSLGCTRGVSCGICDDKLCDECSGFGANLCYTCVTHASGAPGSACSCDQQYYLNPDGFSCSPCTTGCKTCSGNDYYLCTSCINLYYLLSGMCLGYCPTGYTADSTTHECTLPHNPSLSVVLNNDILLNLVDGMNVGNDNSNKYPAWTDANDPTPAILRGYYFYGTQSLSKSSFLISTQFSVLLWLKPIAGGYVAVKSDGTHEYFKLVLDGSGNPNLAILMADSSTVSIAGSSSLLLNNWHFLAVTGTLISGLASVMQLWLRLLALVMLMLFGWLLRLLVSCAMILSVRIVLLRAILTVLLAVLEIW
ncbi:unnamed protein product [Blepharisma stoltei]|uniref:TNFR-Cys domain-containing protein n=1 Tax=Blepharisma stoltei TaxID=1481888 RepID=A0AAU9KJH6_9CILI|nr:unnamed protein product [Blepharisma stoltei]